MRVAFKKRAETIFSKGIQLWTRGPYCHVELLFPDGKSFSSQEGEGVRWKAIGYNERDWDILSLPMDSRDINRIASFCEKEEGCPYDWRGIAFSFLPIPIGWQSVDKWFCSEICTAALQIAGYCTGYAPASVSPNKLHTILSKELNNGH